MTTANSKPGVAIAFVKAVCTLFRRRSQQGWAIPGSAQQYYTQYYTRQKLLSNTNTQYQYYTESRPTIKIKLVRIICLNGLELGTNQLPLV